MGSKAAAIDRFIERNLESFISPATFEWGDNGLDLNLVRDSTRDLPPPSDEMKSRIERLILIEHVENLVGWLALTTVIMTVGTFGAIMERASFWLCLAMVILETMLKLTRKWVQNHYASGVACSFVMLQLAEDTGRYHRYLAAVWFLRVGGIVAQVALAGTLVGRVGTQKALSVEDPGLDRLVEMLHCCYGVAFGQVLLSLFIAFLNSYHATPFSLVLGLKRLLVRRPRQLGRNASATWTRFGTAAEIGLESKAVSGLPPGGNSEAIGGDLPRGESENRNALPRAMEENEVIEDLSAVVWYLHSKQHPLLPAVCAYQTDGSCGLPGHWFLTAEQLLRRAFCEENHKKFLYPSAQSSQVNMDQEMALDALARYAKSRNPSVCKLIVQQKGSGLAKVGDMAASHTSVGCQERAAMILCYLSNIHLRERLSGVVDPFDPLHDTPPEVIEKVGLNMLECLASKASPQLQESAAGTLFALSASYGLSERLFSGEQGKTLIELLVDVAGGEALTDTTCWYTLHVFAWIHMRHVPYVHAMSLRGVENFKELHADVPLEWSATWRPCAGRVAGEKSWILPARAAFRESKALPVIDRLALSKGTSSDCKFALAWIFITYRLLGVDNLFPFEVTELTRLLDIRLESQPLHIVYAMWALCDLFFCYFSRYPPPVYSHMYDFIDRRLVRQEGRRFFFNLARFELYKSSKVVADDQKVWTWFLRLWKKSPPTVLWLSQSPARLLSYLLAHYFDLLRDEIDEVFRDDQEASCSVLIDNGQAPQVATVSLIASSLAALVFGESKESEITKVNACKALTHLATHQNNCLLPNVVEVWEKHVAIYDCGMKDKPEFQSLQKLVGDLPPNCRLPGKRPTSSSLELSEVLRRVTNSSALDPLEILGNSQPRVIRMLPRPGKRRTSSSSQLPGERWPACPPLLDPLEVSGVISSSSSPLAMSGFNQSDLMSFRFQELRECKRWPPPPPPPPLDRLEVSGIISSSSQLPGKRRPPPPPPPPLDPLRVSGIISSSSQLPGKRWPPPPPPPPLDPLEVSGFISSSSSPLAMSGFNQSDVMSFRFQELRECIRGFSEDQRIGDQRSFGMLYRGVLNGKEVAIKVKSGHVKKKAIHQFVAEVSCLTRVHHANLIQLIGYCTDGPGLMLVYPFFPGGSLYGRLFHKAVNRRGAAAVRENPPPPLTLLERMSIAFQVAKGLRYLHDDVTPPILHRDVKSSNILLGEGSGKKLHVVVADFGLAAIGERVLELGHDSITSTSILAGTNGYIAPEYILRGKLTEKNDVYAYGVVVLELLTGCKALVPDSSGVGIQPLVEWARPFLEGGMEQVLQGLLDANLTDEVAGDSMKKMVKSMFKLAWECVAEDDGLRPAMREVVQRSQTLFLEAGCGHDVYDGGSFPPFQPSRQEQ